MGFHQELRAGTWGVKFDPGPDLTVNRESPSMVTFHDGRHLVAWDIRHSPFVAHTSDRWLEHWERQLQREARAQFLDDYRSREHPPGPFNRGPRTDDPRWSPVVEARRVITSAGAALRVVHRMSFEPGREWVLGRLLLAVPQGTIELIAHSISDQTGFRESALYIAAERDGHQPMPPGQDFYDDPRHDKVFPDHPLSRVRRALAWLGTVLERPGPDPDHSERRTPLARHGLSVEAPPRFQLSPAEGTRARGPSIFMRVGLSSLDGNETFDVLRQFAGEHPVSGPQALVDYADRRIRAWKDEGVEDIQVRTEPCAPLAGLPAVRTEVRMRVGQKTFASSLRWLWTAERDIIRSCLSTPPDVSEEERNAELEAAVASMKLTSA